MSACYWESFYKLKFTDNKVSWIFFIINNVLIVLKVLYHKANDQFV